MKKVYSLLIFLLSLSFVPKVEASHAIGGEIRWECVDSGKYVFYLDAYINCRSGMASWNYNNNYMDIDIAGYPLPRGADNNTINTFTVYPDSSKWERLNRGDLSPSCNSNNPDQLSCGDNLATRAYYYKSDTIVLKGVPPASGWIFYYQFPCCRPQTDNLVNPTSKPLYIRAVMYPTSNNEDAFPCLYSSTEFVEPAANLVCRGKSYTYNHSAQIKEEIDSIIYNLDSSYYFYPSHEVRYRTNYYHDNPTPDQLFDSSNVPMNIDSKTGLLNLLVSNGSYVMDYNVVVRADAYKEGQRISSIFREIPYYVFDCPPIDSVTPNNQPDFYFDNVKQEEYEIVVEAGEKIEFLVQAMDNDSGASDLPQEVTMFTSGNQFAIDFVDTANCSNPPCAVLKNNVPQYDSSRNRYQVSGANVVTTDFEWQTNCGHLNADGSQKTYYFYFSAKDDHCPVPQQVDTYVKVTVGAEGIKGAPKVECIEELSSNNQITWSAGQDLVNSFNKWIIYAGNTPPLPIVDSIANFNVKTYVDIQKFAYYQVKASVNPTCVNQSVTLESPIRRSGYQRYPINVSILDTNRIIIAQDSAADSYQWYDCNTDTIITDSTRQSFAPQDSGYYAAIITKGYCSDTTDCVRIFPVGLNENRFQQTVRFYPNPTNGFVNIELPQKQQSIQVKVRNIHGQLVQEKKFVNQGNLQLQLNGKPGIYFIELMNGKGERVNVKVVKR